MTSLEPVSKNVEVELLEAGQIGVPTHHVDNVTDLVHMLLQLVEPLEEQLLEVAIEFGILPLQQLHVLSSEFEGGRLEIPTSWGDAEDKPEVDVHDVALIVDKDIAVVAILNLQDVRKDAVGCQRLCELPLGLVHLESINALVEVIQRNKGLSVLLLQLVQGDPVGDELQDTRTLTCHDYLVRAQIESEACVGEDVPDLGNYLHANDLLSQIVPSLHYHVSEFVAGKLAPWRRHLEPLYLVVPQLLPRSKLLDSGHLFDPLIVELTILYFRMQ